MYFAGFHDSVEKLRSAQWIQMCLGIALTITFLALAMRARRAETPADANWGYGSAFGTGVIAGLVGVVIGAAWSYAYMAFINPGITDLTVQMQIAGMEAKNMSAAQIEQAEPMIRKFSSPVAAVTFQLIGGTIFLLIFTAIVAIFFRKRDAVPQVDAPPALG